MEFPGNVKYPWAPYIIIGYYDILWYYKPMICKLAMFHSCIKLPEGTFDAAGPSVLRACESGLGLGKPWEHGDGMVI